MVGLEPDPADEVYLRSALTIEVPVGVADRSRNEAPKLRVIAGKR